MAARKGVQPGAVTLLNPGLQKPSALQDNGGVKLVYLRPHLPHHQGQPFAVHRHFDVRPKEVAQVATPLRGEGARGKAAPSARKPSRGHWKKQGGARPSARLEVPCRSTWNRLSASNSDERRGSSSHSCRGRRRGAQE